MSRGHAKKKRLHDMRNGVRNPETLRGRAAFSLHERKTMTKSEKRNKETAKHKKRFLSEKRDEGNRFYYAFLDAKRISSVYRNTLSSNKGRFVRSKKHHGIPNILRDPHYA